MTYTAAQIAAHLDGEVIGDGTVQLHGFSAAELRGLGYRVRGFGGPKPLRGAFAELRFRPRPLWHRVSGALQPLTWIWPETAFGLVAVKELRP